MKEIFSVLGVILLMSSCNAQNVQLGNAEASKAEKKQGVKMQVSSIKKIEKSEAEWKKELTDEEYYVLREKGTERAFTGDLLNIKKDGVYTCAACGLALFESSTKFKSGTGWPSFYTTVGKENVVEEEDRQFGMVRTEVLCGRCDGHLGHVFNDGPKPTGLRYCINSVSLDFVEEKSESKK